MWSSSNASFIAYWNIAEHAHLTHTFFDIFYMVSFISYKKGLDIYTSMQVTD